MMDTSARVQDLCSLGTQWDIVGTTSGMAVDTRWVPCLSITPMCAWPCPVLWKWSLPVCFPEWLLLWPLFFPPLHRHDVSSGTSTRCSGFFSFLPATLLLDVFKGCPLSLLFWSGALPQMAHPGCNGQRSDSLFPRRSKCFYLSQSVCFLCLVTWVMETRCREQRGQWLCFQVGFLNVSWWDY